MTLSRIFRRTPSLRTRVAFATAIGAAIVVTIVGTIVWIGITNDRLERLDRRLDEAAGFAVQQLIYERGEQYSREQWLDLVFTYSNHLVLPADRAAEMRSRLAAVIGDGGVQVGGDTLLIVARPVIR